MAATWIVAATAACAGGAPRRADDLPGLRARGVAVIPAAEPADAWNHPNRNFFRCVVLKGDSAPLRYQDGAPIGAPGEYQVRVADARYRGAPGGPDAHDRMSCAPGEIRLDAHEALLTPRGLLHFHKGGQGYADDRVPYGHILASDIVGGDTVSTQRPLSVPPEWGAPSATAGRRWTDSLRNGRGCEPVPGETYRITIVRQGTPRALPNDWQYKPHQSGSRYAKYADAGPEQGAGTARHAYLVWSWMLRGDGLTTSGGGGMVRALLRDGQPFDRCAVEAIDGVAWAPRSDVEAGRVTAVYGRTRSSADVPWVYGWAIFSHRVKLPGGGYAAPVVHMVRREGVGARGTPGGA